MLLVHEVAEGGEEAGHGFARAGGGDKQLAGAGAVAGEDVELVLAGGPAAGGEPVGDDGGESVFQRSHPLPASPIKGEVKERWTGQDRATYAMRHLPLDGGGWEGVATIAKVDNRHLLQITHDPI